MAQDWEQKSVQGIKDPNARKAAYYKLQREDAEEGGNKQLSDKINSKLGRNKSMSQGDILKKGVSEVKSGLDNFTNSVKKTSPASMVAGPELAAGENALGAAAKRFAPTLAEAAQGVERGASKALSGLGKKASEFLGKGEGPASRAVGSKATKGSLAKDFAKGKSAQLEKQGASNLSKAKKSINANAPSKSAPKMTGAARKSKADIAKDFGKQAKDGRPAAPSRQRITTKEVGPASRVDKKSVTHGRKKPGS
jgi:hypothetical protein